MRTLAWFLVLAGCGSTPISLSDGGVIEPDAGAVHDAVSVVVEVQDAVTVDVVVFVTVLAVVLVTVLAVVLVTVAVFVPSVFVVRDAL